MRFLCLTIWILAAFSNSASAEELRLPVPVATIYPRDIITDAIIEERATPQRLIPSRQIITQRSVLVGKIARQTLLPGLPIPVEAVEAPKLVVNGGSVRIVFQNDGISIFTFGQALQNGGLGEMVRVRNSDSGVIVMGLVQQDGSVRVSDL